MWDGQSLIPATATRYIDRNGHHHSPRFAIPFKHSGFGAGGEIIAYTLGETRERDWCRACYGYGFVQKKLSTLKFLHEHKKCLDCKGRGYIWKLGEKK